MLKIILIWIAAVILIAAAVFFLFMMAAVGAAFGPAKKSNFISGNVSGDMASSDRTILANLKKEEAEVKRWMEKKKIRRISHAMADGSLHMAWELGTEKAHRWVLLLHGYRSSGEALLGLAIPYAKEGWHCIVPDSRAQGESGGKWITLGVKEKEDCKEWITEILQKDSEAEILLHGRSMGGATVLMLAADPDLSSHVRGVISDSAPSTAWVMFEHKMREWTGIGAGGLLYPFDFFCRKRIGSGLWDCSPILVVSKIKIPVLLIHGDGDRLVPVDMAYRLCNHVKSPKKLLIIEGADHVRAQQKNPSLFFDTIHLWMAENRLFGMEKQE